jgi:hypothetical protein
MKMTKEIIHDLMPLYAANECSADTRLLVEEYLRENPREAGEIQRLLEAPIPVRVPPAASLAEAQALREARRRIGRQKWLMGLAIFFSLAPLSFFDDNGRVWWCLRDAPQSAAVYLVLAAAFWAVYARERRHPRSL